MKKCMIALIALGMLGNIAAIKPAQARVGFSNGTEKGISDGIFVTVNGQAPFSLPPFDQTAPIPSPQNPIHMQEGPVSRIVVQFASGIRAGSRVVWDWNKYNRTIRNQQADFLKVHPNFPNDVTLVELSTLGFWFTGPDYTKQYFEINCWSKNPMESDQCSNIIK